jgi:hypothetical protein
MTRPFPSVDDFVPGMLEAVISRRDRAKPPFADPGLPVLPIVRGSFLDRL